MGRHPKIRTPEEMEEKMEAYFTRCDEKPILAETINKNGVIINRYKPQPYVLEELALELGLAGVNELSSYTGTDDHLRSTPMSAEEKKTRKNFSQLITRAKSRIAGQLIKFSQLGVYDAKISTLVLATHHGYKDKKQSDVELNWNITFSEAEKSKDKHGKEK